MWLLLTLLIWKGELQFHAYPASSEELCIAAMPFVELTLPDTAQVSCIYLKTEKDI